jgi:hypothetical protein
MKTYGEKAVTLHSFLTFALDGIEFDFLFHTLYLRFPCTGIWLGSRTDPKVPATRKFTSTAGNQSTFFKFVVICFNVFFSLFPTLYSFLQDFNIYLFEVLQCVIKSAPKVERLEYLVSSRWMQECVLISFKMSLTALQCATLLAHPSAFQDKT